MDESRKVIKGRDYKILKRVMGNTYYKEFDKVYYSIEEFLSNYGKSKILQKFFTNAFESLFYGTLINNFFINLNQKNIKENNLPRGQIGKIKEKYKNIQRDAKSALALSIKDKKIDEKYYENFKIKSRVLKLLNRNSKC